MWRVSLIHNFRQDFPFNKQVRNQLLMKDPRLFNEMRCVCTSPLKLKYIN